MLPEAGTQRLRDVINKNITEEDILKSTKMLFEGGWTNVKLYFMIGLPTETMDDVRGIAELAQKVLDVYFEIPKEERAKNINITVSSSSFVPKPFTAFQWTPQNTREQMVERGNKRINKNQDASGFDYMMMIKRVLLKVLFKVKICRCYNKSGGKRLQI